jgi:hypothetical protein
MEPCPAFKVGGNGPGGQNHCAAMTRSRINRSLYSFVLRYWQRVLVRARQVMIYGVRVRFTLCRHSRESRSRLRAPVVGHLCSTTSAQDVQWKVVRTSKWYDCSPVDHGPKPTNLLHYQTHLHIIFLKTFTCTSINRCFGSFAQLTCIWMSKTISNVQLYVYNLWL